MNAKIKKVRLKVLPVLKKYGVVKAGIFGSFARGEGRKDSDIDILIKLKPGKSLLDLISLERELKVLLRRKVDLLTYDSINYLLKKRVLAEEVRIM